jgi:hypothetical protein
MEISYLKGKWYYQLVSIYNLGPQTVWILGQYVIRGGKRHLSYSCVHCILFACKLLSAKTLNKAIAIIHHVQSTYLVVRPMFQFYFLKSSVSFSLTLDVVFPFNVNLFTISFYVPACARDTRCYWPCSLFIFLHVCKCETSFSFRQTSYSGHVN